nr:immunoglobulin heavy chain junction region [Mus musculus]
CAIGTGHYYW